MKWLPLGLWPTFGTNSLYKNNSLVPDEHTENSSKTDSDCRSQKTHYSIRVILKYL